MVTVKQAFYLALLLAWSVPCLAVSGNDSDPTTYNTPHEGVKLSVPPIKTMSTYASKKMILTIHNQSGYFVSSIFQGCTNWASGSGWLLSGLKFQKMLPGETRSIVAILNESPEYICSPNNVQVINVYCQADRTGLTLDQSSPWFAARSIKVRNQPTQEIIVTNELCRAPKDASAL